jgi:Surface antigen variable number repeat
MKRIFFLILIWCLAAPLSIPAQTRGGNKPPVLAGYKLLALKATGTTRYTDKEILAASGLQIGQSAADGDFKEAAHRLGDSGLFTDVAYSFSYSDEGVKAAFQLTDVDKSKLVPAAFENFVWFTDAELLKAIQAHIPLFKDLVPVTGRMPDQVNEVLQALLNEKHIPGRVQFLRQGHQGGGDLTGIVYRVVGIAMRIRNLDFPGATPEQTAFLTNAVHKLVGVEYSRLSLATVAKFDLVPLFRERGYLKVAFAPSSAHAVTPTEGEALDENETEVDASLPVTPGKQYLVSGVTWKGTSAIPTDEASHLFHLGSGQPANAVRLEQDAAMLVKIYRSRGYMLAEIKPEAQINDDNSTVHYDMNVSEGDLYRMGEVEFVGVDSPSRDRLREAWTLQEGKPYNADYTRKFLEDSPRLLPRGLQYSIQLSEELDAKDKTVDVTVHYKVK